MTETAVAERPDFFAFHTRMESDLRWGAHKKVGQRRGQYVMNCLATLYPDMYATVTTEGTIVDPFYRDDVLDDGSFWDFVMERWED